MSNRYLDNIHLQNKSNNFPGVSSDVVNLTKPLITAKCQNRIIIMIGSKIVKCFLMVLVFSVIIRKYLEFDHSLLAIDYWVFLFSITNNQQGITNDQGNKILEP